MYMHIHTHTHGQCFVFVCALDVASTHSLVAESPGSWGYVQAASAPQVKLIWDATKGQLVPAKEGGTPQGEELGWVSLRPGKTMEKPKRSGGFLLGKMIKPRDFWNCNGKWDYH